MMKYFAKGILFSILTLNNGAGVGGAEINQADVFLPLCLCSFKKKVRLVMFLLACDHSSRSVWRLPLGPTVSPRAILRIRTWLQRALQGLQSVITGVLKCAGDVRSEILTGVWAARRNWKGVSRIDQRRSEWLLRAPLRSPECLWIGLKCS